MLCYNLHTFTLTNHDHTSAWLRLSCVQHTATAARFTAEPCSNQNHTFLFKDGPEQPCWRFLFFFKHQDTSRLQHHSSNTRSVDPLMVRCWRQLRARLNLETPQHKEHTRGRIKGPAVTTHWRFMVCRRARVDSVFTRLHMFITFMNMYCE